MGEAASSWKTPLHSSGSEAPDQVRRESKGKGGAFDIEREGHESLLKQGDPTAGIQTHSTQDCNPFTRKG
jgi:hypothetical protein